MQVEIKGECVQVGDLDSLDAGSLSGRPSAWVQREDGSEIVLVGITQEQARQICERLYESVRLCIDDQN